MICAIYGRKSRDDSDRDKEARSTTRQVERAAEYARARGWTVDARYVFTDDAVSGAEWQRRPGFNALLAALEPAPPFGALVISELSRIGRDPRTLAAMLRIEDAGVEIHGYLKGRQVTLDDEAGEVEAYVDSLVASLERRRARARTYDALRRRAEAGAVAGGRVYGFQNVRNGDGYVYRVIDPVEAAIIQRMFTMYAEGAGMVTIAHAFNADGIPSPRAGSGSWTPTAIREMLCRPLYAGRMTWNRTQKITRRGTKGQRQRPEAEWLERPAPDLAIVESPLWRRVQTRIAARATAIAMSGKPGGRRYPDDSDYLLVGFARCRRCGGPIGTDLRAHGSAGQRQHVPHYACLDHKKRGPAICTNAVGLAQAVLDRAVLDAIVEALHPRVLEDAIEKAIAILTEPDTSQSERREKVERELLRVQSRIDRLVSALADATLPADEIRPQLAAEKARKTALKDELAQLDHASGARPDVTELRQRVQSLAADVAEVFSGATSETRRVLRALLAGRIELEPFGRGRQRGYCFRGELTIGRIITGATSLKENTSKHGGPNGIRAFASIVISRTVRAA